MTEYSKLILNGLLGFLSTMLQLSRDIQAVIAILVGCLTAIYLVYQIIKINRDIKTKK